MVWTSDSCSTPGSGGHGLFRLSFRRVRWGLSLSPGNRQPELLAQSGFDFGANIGVFLQKDPGILAPLAHAFGPEAEPGAAFFDNVVSHTKVEQIAFKRDTFAIENVEFRFAEGRGHLVFHHFSSRARAYHAIAFLD